MHFFQTIINPNLIELEKPIVGKYECCLTKLYKEYFGKIFSILIKENLAVGLMSIWLHDLS